MRKLVNSSFFVYLYYMTIGTAGQKLYVKTKFNKIKNYLRRLL